MGFFNIFKRKKFETIEDDEDDIEEKNAPVVPPEVSIDGGKDSPLELKICKPTSFEQALYAIDYLVAGRTVLLNLESVEKDVYKRIIDFVSGAAYALGLTIKKATNDSYFIAPHEVDVSGEVFATEEEDEEYFTI